MKKVILIFVFFSNISIVVAQSLNAPLLKPTDPTLALAKMNNLNKMKEVLSIANGFIDVIPIPAQSKNGTRGYYQATNGGDGGFIFYLVDAQKSVFSYGAIRKKHLELGLEQGVLGFPIEDAVKVKSSISNNIITYCVFENGAINIKPGKPAVAILQPVYQKYRDMGGPASKFGAAMTEYNKSFFGFGTDGQYQQKFENGAFWGNATSAYSMHGAIWKKYTAANCGLPVEDQKGDAKLNTASLKCEKGTMVWGEKTGAWLIKDKFLKKWQDIATTSGMPLSNQTETGEMLAQNFENGLMLLVAGKVTFVPDDNEKNSSDNNKIRQINKLGVIKFAPVKIN